MEHSSKDVLVWALVQYGEQDDIALCSGRTGLTINVNCQLWELTHKGYLPDSCGSPTTPTDEFRAPC